MYTSGTTGLPKGAVVTHGNLESNVYNQAIADKADPDDVNLTATPLYHMGALFMATTYTALGCTNPILERFEPGGRRWPRSSASGRRPCLLVPTMLNAMLNAPERSASTTSARCGSCSTAAARCRCPCCAARSRRSAARSRRATA